MVLDEGCSIISKSEIAIVAMWLSQLSHEKSISLSQGEQRLDFPEN